ncbi:MAG: GNAT family N-acetyltransferase [Nocardioides sp.]
MVEILEVDPHDLTLLQQYWDVEQAAQRHDRTRPVLRTFETLKMVGVRQAYYEHVLLAAVEGDDIVGTADIGLSLVDNRHLAEVEVNVRPDRRRQGIGRALLGEVAVRCEADGRTTLIGEAHSPAGADPGASPATAFALASGFDIAHQEDHLLLELPAEPPGAAEVPGYRVLTWGTHTPEEHMAQYCELRTQMSIDVPSGEVDAEPIEFDAERLRTSEARTEQLYDRVTAVVQAEDGRFAGYTLVFLPRGTSECLQDDTFVRSAHRGRRLGTAMKLATLDVVRREHPERTAIHTWTAVDNVPMQRTNRDFGYRPIERMHEMQRKVADA